VALKVVSWRSHSPIHRCQCLVGGFRGHAVKVRGVNHCGDNFSVIISSCFSAAGIIIIVLIASKSSRLLTRIIQLSLYRRWLTLWT